MYLIISIKVEKTIKDIIPVPIYYLNDPLFMYFMYFAQVIVGTLLLYKEKNYVSVAQRFKCIIVSIYLV